MDPLLIELSRQGLGFLLAALMALAYFRKDKALTDSFDRRIEDNNRLASVIEATNAASKSLELASSQRTVVIEKVGETTQAVADAIRSLSASLDAGKATAESNRMALVQVLAQLHSLERAIQKLDEDHQAAARVRR